MLTQVAEHHRLHVDGGAPGFRDVVEFAVDLGALVVPALEHSDHRAPELCPRFGREVAAEAGVDQRLEAPHQLLQVGGVEFGVEQHAALALERVDHDFEGIVFFLRRGFEAHDDVAVHLDEAAVRVPGEALVAGLARQAEHRFVVEAEVEDRVHHARHRGARARAHRDQQRILGVAEAFAHLALDRRDAVLHFVADQRQHGIAAVTAVDRAGLGADREAGRHRNAEPAHLG